MRKIDFFNSYRWLMRTGLCVVALLLGLTASAQEVVVVENLANYTGTDAYVYNKADGKTYARNNLGEYELYGIYEKVTSLKINDPNAEMQPAEYVQSNGGYFDTGYKPTRNTVIEAVYKSPDGPDFKALYGTRFEANDQNSVPFPGTSNYSAGNGWKHGFAFFPTNGVINLGGETGSRTDEFRTTYNKKVIVEQDAALGTLNIYDGEDEDEEYITTITDSPLTGDCETSLYILAINKHLPVIEGYNTDPNAFGANSDPCINTLAKLYSLKICEGDLSNVKHNFVPVLAGGKGALYDVINDTIFTSIDGDVIAGGIDGGTGTTVYPGKMVYNTTDQKTYKYNAETKQFELVGDGNRTLEEIASTDYKDLNNWVTNKDHMAIFSGKWQSEGEGDYKIDPYVGTGGHEPLMTQVPLEVKSEYNFSFTSSWSAYNSWHTTEMHAYVCNFWDLGTQESGLDVSGSVLATQAFSFDGGEDEEFSLDFTADRENQTLVFQFGDVADGENGFWFQFNNLSVKKYAYPEAYPVLNIYAPRINDLLSQIDEYESGTTTALQTALDNAIAVAQTALEGDALDPQKEALDALQAAFDKAKTITTDMIDVLNATATLAKADGVSVSAETETFGTVGTEVDQYNTLLSKVRADRKVSHIEKDNATYEGNAPADGGKFYLYNVGRKAYLTSGSDWGTHAALGWPGLEATLAEFGEGYSIQFNELIQVDARDKYLNGSPYCDGADGDKGTYFFEPVAGKTNVYNIRGDRGYLAFDPDGAVDDGGIKHFNTVTAMWATPANEDAEWMLVTKDERLAQMDNATADNPVDVTVVIKNASFNKYANLENPWEGINQGWGWDDRNFSDKNTEHFHNVDEESNFSLNQAIDLPKAGWYALSVQGYYRDGNIDPHVEKIVNDDELAEPAVLWVTGNSVNEEVPLVYIHEEADKAPGEGTNTAIGNFPDNMIQASKFFENGLYTNILKFEASDADLENVLIGVDELEDNREDSWIVLDNFRLWYYGNGEEPDLTGINQAVVEKQDATTKGQKAVYDLYGRKVAGSKLSSRNLPKGIYIINGKKVVKK